VVARYSVKSVIEKVFKMQGYKYNTATGVFISDVVEWDGETQPEDINEAITGKQPLSGCYIHKFENGEWGEGDPDAVAKRAAQADSEFNAIVDAELMALDLASIRSIREYIAARPDAPSFLVDIEATVATKRETRK